MTKEQIEKNRKLFDLIGAAAGAFAAFLVGLLLLSFDLEDRGKDFYEEKILTLILLIALLVVYPLAWFVVWNLNSRYKFGGRFGWLWILLLSGTTVWHLFAFGQTLRLQNVGFGDALNETAWFLYLLLAVSFVPMVFVWFIGFCCRAVWGNASEQTTSLKLT